MKPKRSYLTKTADGRLMLVFTKPELFKLIWIRLLLQLKYGFHREGHRIIGGGEAIFHDFVRGNIRLFAGYESMIGFNLSSASEESDTFLREFAKSHAQQDAAGDAHTTGVPEL